MNTLAHVTGRLLATAIFLVVAGLIAILVVVPRLTGAAALSVLTGSMEPTIPTGSVVLVRPIDPAMISRGDVITYQVAPDVQELITHRVTKVHRDTRPVSFTTKGDNNRGEDLDPVPAGAIRGEVWFHVPLVGYASEYARSRAAIGLLAILVGLSIISALLSRVGKRGEDSTEAAALAKAT